MTRSLTAAGLILLCSWPLLTIERAMGRRGPDRPLVLAEREAYVMGTSVRLVTLSPDGRTGLSRLESALEILEDTDKELSTWRPESAISEFNRAPVGTPWQLSKRLCSMFAVAFDWQQATGGAFDAAVGALVDAWGIHDSGRIPSPAALADARARSGSRLIEFDRRACALTRRAGVTIDVGAFGKGEGLDRASAILAPGGWMINLGGQVSVAGPGPGGQPWTVDVADPLKRDRAAFSVRFNRGSLSTSAGSERDLLVDGRRVGHLLDPRTGMPAPFRGSVSVWHEQALVADILSTALYVMGPETGLPWAESRGLSAAYLVPGAGRVRLAATSSFVDRLEPVPAGS